MKRCHFELHKDSRDPVGRETYKVDCLAIKNVQGGMKDAKYTIKPKYIVPNPSYSPTGDVYTDAKFCPFICCKLYFSKLPNGCETESVFLKPNTAYRKSNNWYCGQPMFEGTIKNRIKALTGLSSHALKRSGACALAETP
ncbi:hypothetical protein HaLaN_06353, partial [Haematococcus lacustris]